MDNRYSYKLVSFSFLELPFALSKRVIKRADDSIIKSIKRWNEISTKIKFLLFNNRSTLYQLNIKFYPNIIWQNYSFDFIKNSKSIQTRFISNNYPLI